MRPPPIRFLLARSKATLNRTYKNNKSGERPPYHPPDPLANKTDPRALATPLLDDDLTFVHRPPPTFPTPFSLTSAPSSPLLRKPAAAVTAHTTPATSASASASASLPPVLRTRTPPPRLPRAALERLRTLRLSDPKTYTRGALAKMFGCTPAFVGYVAALPRAQRKPIVRARDAAHERRREGWGARKALAKAVGVKRREFW